jgi:hypothetical protein
MRGVKSGTNGFASTSYIIADVSQVLLYGYPRDFSVKKLVKAFRAKKKGGVF